MKVNKACNILIITFLFLLLVVSDSIFSIEAKTASFLVLGFFSLPKKSEEVSDEEKNAENAAAKLTQNHAADFAAILLNEKFKLLAYNQAFLEVSGHNESALANKKLIHFIGEGAEKAVMKQIKQLADAQTQKLGLLPFFTGAGNNELLHVEIHKNKDFWEVYFLTETQRKEHAAGVKPPEQASEMQSAPESSVETDEVSLKEAVDSQNLVNKEEEHPVLWLTDSLFIYQFNHAFLTVSKYEQADLAYKSIYSFVGLGKDDNVEATIKQVGHGEKAEMAEFPFLNADYQTHNVRAEIQHLAEEDAYLKITFYFENQEAEPDDASSFDSATTAESVPEEQNEERVDDSSETKKEVEHEEYSAPVSSSEAESADADDSGKEALPQTFLALLSENNHAAAHINTNGQILQANEAFRRFWDLAETEDDWYLFQYLSEVDTDLMNETLFNPFASQEDIDGLKDKDFICVKCDKAFQIEATVINQSEIPSERAVLITPIKVVKEAPKQQESSIDAPQDVEGDQVEVVEAEQAPEKKQESVEAAESVSESAQAEEASQQPQPEVLNSKLKEITSSETPKQEEKPAEASTSNHLADQKAEMQLLSKVVERLNAEVENAAIPIFRTNAKGEVLSENKAFESLKGHFKETKHFLDVFPEADRRFWKSIYETALKSGEGLRFNGIALHSANENPIKVDYQAHVLLGSQGQLNMMHYLKPAKTEKVVDEAAEKRFQKMQEIIHLAPYGMAILDEKGEFKTVNKTLADMLGNQLEDFKGQSLHYFLPANEAGQETMKVWQENYSHQSYFQLTFDLMQFEGVFVKCFCQVYPFDKTGENLRICYFKDIGLEKEKSDKKDKTILQQAKQIEDLHNLIREAEEKVTAEIKRYESEQKALSSKLATAEKALEEAKAAPQTQDVDQAESGSAEKEARIKELEKQLKNEKLKTEDFHQSLQDAKEIEEHLLKKLESKGQGESTSQPQQQASEEVAQLKQLHEEEKEALRLENEQLKEALKLAEQKPAPAKEDKGGEVREMSARLRLEKLQEELKDKSRVIEEQRVALADLEQKLAVAKEGASQEDKIIYEQQIQELNRYLVEERQKIENLEAKVTDFHQSLKDAKEIEEHLLQKIEQGGAKPPAKAPTTNHQNNDDEVAALKAALEETRNALKEQQAQASAAADTEEDGVSQEALENMQQQLALVADEKEALEAKVNQLEEALQKAKATTAKPKPTGDVKEISAKLQVEHLQKEIKEKNRIIDGLKAQVIEQQSQIEIAGDEASEEDKIAYEQEINRLKEAVAVLQNQKENLELKVEDFRRSLREGKEIEEHLLKKLRKYESLPEDAAELQENVLKLKADLEAANLLIEDLQQKGNSTDVEASQSDESQTELVADYEKQLKTLQQQYQKAQEQIAELKEGQTPQSSEEDREQLEALQLENKQLKETLSALSAESNQEDTATANLEKQNQELQEKLAALQQKIDGYQEAEKQSKLQVEQKDQDLEKSHRKLTQELDAWKAKLQKSEKALHELQLKYDELEDKQLSLGLEEALETKTKALDYANRKVERLEGNIQKFKTAIQENREFQDQLLQKLEQKEQDLEDLATELETYKQNQFRYLANQKMDALAAKQTSIKENLSDEKRTENYAADIATLTAENQKLKAELTSWKAQGIQKPSVGASDEAQNSLKDELDAARRQLHVAEDLLAQQHLGPETAEEERVALMEQLTLAEEMAAQFEAERELREAIEAQLETAESLVGESSGQTDDMQQALAEQLQVAEEMLQEQSNVAEVQQLKAALQEAQKGQTSYMSEKLLHLEDELEAANEQLKVADDLLTDYHSLNDALEAAEQQLELSDEMHRHSETETSGLTQDLREELEAAQQQLALAEEMSSRSVDMPTILNKLNSPFAAFYASSGNMVENYYLAMNGLVQLMVELPEGLQEVFTNFVKAIITSDYQLTTKEERKIRKQIQEAFEEAEVKDADLIANLLVDIKVFDDLDKYIPLFESEKSNIVQNVAYYIGQLKLNIENTRDASVKMRKVIEALNFYFKDKVGGQVEEVNLTEVIDKRIKRQKVKKPEKVEISFDNPDNINALAFGNEQAFNLLFKVLLDNAMEAVQEEGSIRVQLEQLSGEYVITVSDDGKPIEEAQLDQIFKPFYSTSETGVGLSLDLAQGIVADTEGSIEVFQENGQKHFVVKLPFRDDRQIVLIVDDEKVVGDAIKQELNAAFGNAIRIYTAKSANEAHDLIAELQQEHYQVALVISDWLMPVVKGDTFLIDLHRKYPEMKKVMVSAYVDGDALKRVKKYAELDDFFRKPWNEEKLVASVGQLLSLKQGE